MLDLIIWQCLVVATGELLPFGEMIEVPAPAGGTFTASVPFCNSI
jgi:hypothetical protein